MMDVGRLCVKVAGRDAGKTCVIVQVVDGNYVVIDGQTRRKKANKKHLEPLEQTISIKENASHEQIVKEFGKLSIEIKETQEKKKAGPKPVKKRKK